MTNRSCVAYKSSPLLVILAALPFVPVVATAAVQATKHGKLENRRGNSKDERAIIVQFKEYGSHAAQAHKLLRATDHIQVVSYRRERFAAAVPTDFLLVKLLHVEAWQRAQTITALRKIPEVKRVCKQRHYSGDLLSSASSSVSTPNGRSFSPGHRRSSGFTADAQEEPKRHSRDLQGKLKPNKAELTRSWRENNCNSAKSV
eukprot:SAG31_NODE_11032_length_1072_cov_1.662898_1_plen_201_part_10